MTHKEGLGEIVSAQLRVASAKKWAETSAKTRLMAQDTLEAAKQDECCAREEVKEAEAYLKSVEKKWEVCNVYDSDTEDDEQRDNAVSDDDVLNEDSVDAANEGTTKKRAVSLSPILYNEERNAGKKARREPSDNVRDVELIKVAGCGVPEVNGTYKKHGTINGAPTFVKSGLWDGESISFEVWRARCGTWIVWAKDICGFFYESTDVEDVKHYLLPVGKKMESTETWCSTTSHGGDTPMKKLQRNITHRLSRMDLNVIELFIKAFISRSEDCFMGQFLFSRILCVGCWLLTMISIIVIACTGSTVYRTTNISAKLFTFIALSLTSHKVDY